MKNNLQLSPLKIRSCKRDKSSLIPVPKKKTSSEDLLIIKKQTSNMNNKHLSKLLSL